MRLSNGFVIDKEKTFGELKEKLAKKEQEIQDLKKEAEKW